MQQLKLSTAKNEMVFLVDETDGKTGLPGLTLTITASKNGGAFASVTPTVTDRGSGWYNLALTTSHTDTLGNLALHITSTGADPLDVKFEVGTRLPSEVWSEAIPDSMSAVASIPSLSQAILGIYRFLCTKRLITGSEMQTFKENGDPAMTFDLDSPTNPTNYDRST